MAAARGHAGRGRIGNGEQVLVEPPHFAVGENADLNRGEDIGEADGARGDFGTACKYLDHAVDVRRGGNEAGHGQIARYQAVVKLILVGRSSNLPCFRHRAE